MTNKYENLNQCMNLRGNFWSQRLLGFVPLLDLWLAVKRRSGERQRLWKTLMGGREETSAAYWRVRKRELGQPFL